VGRQRITLAVLFCGVAQRARTAERMWRVSRNSGIDAFMPYYAQSFSGEAAAVLHALD
jgi:hypothetical protein